MQHRYIKTLLVSAAFACLLSVSALAANDGAGTVNASDVNLRSGASLSSDVIKTVDANTPLVVIDSSDSEWYKVWCPGSEGYMSSDYVSFADVLDASFGTGTISGTMVRLRSGASTASDTLAYFDTGDSMTVTGVNGCWYKVTAGSMSGYVHSDYLALANQVLAAPTVTTESVSTAQVSSTMCTSRTATRPTEPPPPSSATAHMSTAASSSPETSSVSTAAVTAISGTAAYT